MAGTRRSGVGSKKTQRLNLQVGVEAVERLLIHSIKAKVSPGELVTQLIEQHLRQWKVQSNSTARATETGSAKSDDQVEATAEKTAA
jgi:hypothetical protein